MLLPLLHVAKRKRRCRTVHCLTGIQKKKEKREQFLVSKLLSSSYRYVMTNVFLQRVNDFCVLFPQPALCRLACLCSRKCRCMFYNHQWPWRWCGTNHCFPTISKGETLPVELKWQHLILYHIGKWTCHFVSQYGRALRHFKWWVFVLWKAIYNSKCNIKNGGDMSVWPLFPCCSCDLLHVLCSWPLSKSPGCSQYN